MCRNQFSLCEDDLFFHTGKQLLCDVADKGETSVDILLGFLFIFFAFVERRDMSGIKRLETPYGFLCTFTVALVKIVGNLHEGVCCT